MIAVYCRVSSTSQRTDSQLPDLRRWLTGNQVPEESVRWFEEKMTGRTSNRPAFDALQSAVFHGEVKTVVVWKLDRIARKSIDGILCLAKWCEAGVRVVSVTEQIDLSGPVGQMMASVLFGISEIEYVRTRERQAAGIAVAKEKGIYRGRKPGSSKADPARARELINSGWTLKEVGGALGVSPRTVSRYLRGPDKESPA